MKLTARPAFRPDDCKTVDAAEAVAFVAHKAAALAEGSLERVQARADAVEAMLGRLIGVLIERGLTPEQVSTIFDYDVIAED